MVTGKICCLPAPCFGKICRVSFLAMDSSIRQDPSHTAPVSEEGYTQVWFTFTYVELLPGNALFVKCGGKVDRAPNQGIKWAEICPGPTPVHIYSSFTSFFFLPHQAEFALWTPVLLCRIWQNPYWVNLHHSWRFSFWSHL